MEEKQEHLMVGSKDSRCEFCDKNIDGKIEELVTDIDNCEIYAHPKCYERAKMLLAEFEQSYEDIAETPPKKQ